MSDKKNEHRERWVYAGVVKGVKKYFHIYLVASKDVTVEWKKQRDDIPPLAENTLMGSANYHLFSAKLAGYGTGAVIEVTVVNDEEGEFSEVYTGESLKQLGYWHHENQRNEWYLRDKTTRAERAAKNKRNKEMRRNPVFEALEPVRKVYKNVSSGARVQILAYIIERITR